MADPLTTTIRLTQPTVSGDSGLWGGLLNSDLSYVDEAINQSITVSIADTNVTLTADGSSSDQARYLRYNFTGALTADRTVTLPANVKVGWATNNTTGGHNVILSAGGTTLSLTDTSWTFFQCDGTNVTSPTVKITVPQAGAASTQQPLRADQTWQEIATYSPSGASSQAILLTSGFRRYRLTFQGVTVNTSTAALDIQFSTNGGVSYINSGYAQFGFYNNNTTPTAFNTTATAGLLTLGLSTSAGIAADGTFEIYPGTASLVAMCHGKTAGFSSGGNWYAGQFNNSLSVTAAINAVNVFTSTGTFSGTLILEGLP